jgi:signal transduction histidine kinase
VLRGTGSEVPDTDDRRRVSLHELDALVERARSAGLTIEVARAATPPSLAPAIELAVYRIVQEALTNVLRHAGRHAKVTLSVAYHTDRVDVSIVDDGGDRLAPVGGPDGTYNGARRPVPAHGNGLVGMRERVAVHGGQFSAGPRFDGGWAVDAAIPVEGIR